MCSVYNTSMYDPILVMQLKGLDNDMDKWKLDRSSQQAIAWYGPYRNAVKKILRSGGTANYTSTGRYRYNCVTASELAARGVYKDIVHYLAKSTGELKKHSLLTVQQVAMKALKPVIKVLLASGCYVYESDESDLTALHFVLLRNHYPCVKRWCHPITAADALDMISVHYSLAFMSILKCFWYNVRTLNVFRNSALRSAIDLDSIETVKSLLEFGANVDDMNENGRTIVQEVASEASNLLMMKLLLSFKPKILISYKDNTTLLHLAVRWCTAAWVDLLVLNHHVDVNTTRVDGETAFEIACKYGNEKALARLLDYECSIDFSPKAIAGLFRNQVVMDVFIKHCAKLHAIGRTYSLIFVELFNNNSLFDSIHKKCIAELELLKTIRNQRNLGATLYDLLVGDVHRAALRLQHVNMCPLLKSTFSNTPLYGDMVRCKIRLAYKRITLLDELEKIERPFGICKLPNLCDNHILQFLPNHYIKKLIFAHTGKYGS